VPECAFWRRHALTRPLARHVDADITTGRSVVERSATQVDETCPSGVTVLTLQRQPNGGDYAAFVS
jgi:hypothetical protein